MGSKKTEDRWWGRGRLEIELVVNKNLNKDKKLGRTNGG